MKVSIITAAFNSELHISDTILSVLGQSYSNIEYILIDGDSFDKTINIINLHREKFDNLTLVSEKDKGVYAKN